MKRGTILKNLWAGYDCYLVYWGRGHGRDFARMICVHNANGKWEIRNAEYYTSDLKDQEHFPVVGYIDLNTIIKTAVLDIHDMRVKDEADKRGKGNLQEV